MKSLRLLAVHAGDARCAAEERTIKGWTVRVQDSLLGRVWNPR